jgi:hypothetical protein
MDRVIEGELAMNAADYTLAERKAFDALFLAFLTNDDALIAAARREWIVASYQRRAFSG